MPSPQFQPRGRDLPVARSGCCRARAGGCPFVAAGRVWAAGAAEMS